MLWALSGAFGSQGAPSTRTAKKAQCHNEAVCWLLTLRAGVAVAISESRRNIMRPKPAELMARIRVWSDLHFEMSAQRLAHDRLPSSVDADLVVLAGDIDAGDAGVRWAAGRFHGVPVVYVLGNHELYGGVIDDVYAACREAAVGTHVHVLENESLDVADIRVLGTTLWTDYALLGSERVEAAQETAAGRLADHRYVSTPSGQQFMPTDASSRHSRALAWLGASLARASREDIPTVVVTHHAPSIRCLKPRHRAHPDLISPAFASDLEPIMLRADAPAVWIYGHTHGNWRGRIGKTFVAANALGYLHHFEGDDFVDEGAVLPE